MFTGIIEEIGRIRSIERQGLSARLVIDADKVLVDTQVGDSIDVNGVCLTVTSLNAGSFSTDVMHETLSRSALGELAFGDGVNLERALTLESRLGGHIVSGHIDGTGIVDSITPDGIAKVMKIRADETIMRYIVEKGSVAINGVSLTVAAVSEGSFSVSIIPHSAEQTTLDTLHATSKVNIECDLIGKYVERLMTFSDVAGRTHSSSSSSENEAKGVSLESLIEAGF